MIVSAAMVAVWFALQDAAEPVEQSSWVGPVLFLLMLVTIVVVVIRRNKKK